MGCQSGACGSVSKEVLHNFFIGLFWDLTFDRCDFKYIKFFSCLSLGPLCCQCSLDTYCNFLFPVLNNIPLIIVMFLLFDVQERCASSSTAAESHGS